MSAVEVTPDEADRVARTGMYAFFAAIAKETGAPTGDLAPIDLMSFEASCGIVTEKWMRANLA